MKRLLLIAAMASAACSSTATPTVSIALSPVTATISTGATQAFSTTVGGTSNAGITWSVTEADGGTVADGLYTAPATAGTYHVVATTAADTSKKATATVTVTTPVVVTVSPATVSLLTGATQTFTATVTGATNTAVTWSVEEIGDGTVTTAGVYTAPSNSGTYRVIATSVADGTKVGSAVVTVGAIGVSIAPGLATLITGAQQTFTATITGSTNTAATWTVENGGGTITPTGGVYTAPATAGIYHVVATSAADTSKKATAVVIVNQVAVFLSPTSATVAPNGTQAFTATVTGTTNSAVNWTVAEDGGGTFTSGVYTAPATAGTYHLVATSAADPSKSATATITVPISITLSPTSKTMGPGEQQQFTATVTGTGNHDVIWSVAEWQPSNFGGQNPPIDQTGLLTAPSQNGIYHVVATSLADPSVSALAEIKVSMTVSGTVTYEGSKTGHVYLVLEESFGGGGNANVIGGTTISAPGPFTIHGVTASGSGNNAQLFLSAWLDSTGSTPTYVGSLDPYGTAFQAFPEAASVTGFDVTLVDPTVSTPKAPPNLQFVGAGSHTALIAFPGTKNNNSPAPLVDHYKFYAYQTSSDCQAANLQPSPVTLTIPAWASNVAFMGGLTDGTMYCFAYTQIASGNESPKTSYGDPVTIGPATGGVTVSGSVTDANFTGTGHLIIAALLNGQQPVAFARIPQTANPQPYTLTGLTPGTYGLALIYDQHDVGYIDPAADNNTSGNKGNNAPSFTVSDAALTGVDETLTGSGPSALMFTSRSTQYASNQADAGLENGYTSLAAYVTGGNIVPYSVELVSGPNVVGSDMGFNVNNGGGEFGWLTDIPLTGGIPAGATFGFNVVSASGTTPISVVCPAPIPYVTNQRPSNGQLITTLTPTFTWTAPNPAPASYSYQLRVQALNGATMWQLNNIDSSTTSATYNSDSQANAPLIDGDYTWSLQVQDHQNSWSQVQTNFSVQAN